MPKAIYARVEEDGKIVRRLVVLYEKPCEACGTEFLPKRQASKYCSLKCQKKAEHLAHREESNEHKRKYYQEHKEEYSLRKKKLYWSDPEKYRQYTRDYWKDRREEKRQKDRDQKDKARHGGFAQELIENSNSQCELCGAKVTGIRRQIHHFTMDKTDHDHQVVLCASCHGKQHGKQPKISHDKMRVMVVEAIRNNKTVEQAYKSLGISRAWLYRLRKKYGLI